jgi:glucose/arabinose dehydrogenase
MEYDELSVVIEPQEGGPYKVRASGPTGAAEGTFEPPFTDEQLEIFVLRVGRARRGVRHIGSPEMQRAQAFGTRLFDALFQTGVRDVYRDSVVSTQARNKGLRLKLCLNQVPELMHVPWEYLYEDPDFLSISGFTPIVRYLELPRTRPPLEVELPLRILGMVSAPVDAVQLDIDAEKEKLERALDERDLIESGLVQIRWLEAATLRALQRELRVATYHVFHYIGHGGYDEQQGESVLLLEDQNQRGRPVGGRKLGTILADHRSLRLAVLNACEAARSSVEDVFAGVATSLVRRDIPAVVAMQFEITDQAAIAFAEEFYAALLDGAPVDWALAEARKAIYADDNDIEWGTPVLFMRVPDGRVFHVVTDGAPRPQATMPQPEAEVVEAENDEGAEASSAAMSPSQVEAKAVPPQQRAVPALKGGRAAEVEATFVASEIVSVEHVGESIWGGAALSPDGRYLATTATGPGESVRIWEVPGGRQVLSLKAPSSPFALAFSPDGRYLASGITLWELPEGREVLSLKGGGSVAFSPDGRLLATAGWVWELPGGREVIELKAGNHLNVAFSPDGHLLTTSTLSTARVWELPSGREVGAVKHGNFWNNITDVAFSPDGRYLATVSKTVRMWKLPRCLEAGSVGHEGISKLAFSPDGRYLVTTGHDDVAARVWELLKGREIERVSHPGVYDVAFSSDGRYLVTAGKHTARVWQVSSEPSA